MAILMLALQSYALLQDVNYLFGSSFWLCCDFVIPMEGMASGRCRSPLSLLSFGNTNSALVVCHK